MKYWVVTGTVLFGLALWIGTRIAADRDPCTRWLRQNRSLERASRTGTPRSSWTAYPVPFSGTCEEYPWEADAIDLTLSCPGGSARTFLANVPIVRTGSCVNFRRFYFPQGGSDEPCKPCAPGDRVVVGVSPEERTAIDAARKLGVVQVHSRSEPDSAK